MAIIDVAGFRISSYPGPYWGVGIVRRRSAGKTAGKEYIAEEKFYGTLQQAITSLLDRRLAESNAGSLEEVAQEIVTFKADLADRFKLRIEVKP